METTEKIIIYQVFTRLFGNQNKPAVRMAALKKTDVER